MTIETVRSDDRQSPVEEERAQPCLPPLTGNQRMIYGALLELGRTAKAYELLDILREQGVKAAPTIYRALNELMEKGLVQHIVSMQTFVALPTSELTQGQKVMLVCDECGKARPLDNKPILAALRSNARKSGFDVKSYHLEISASCGQCGCGNGQVS